MHIGVPWCHHCVNNLEDVLQVLLHDCSLAKSIWCNLLKIEARANFYVENLQGWIHMKLYHKLGMDGAESWVCVWEASCHFLWMWHNREVHGDARVRLSHPWRNKQADDSIVGGHTKHRVEVDVMWKKPEGGWIRLNTDVASKRDIPTGSGGLFRNAEGKWISGFSHNLSRCNAYLSELCGVFDGLQIARERGFSKVELHVDSSVVVWTLQTTKDGSWEVKICHSYREVNSCADTLANMDCEHAPGLRVYEQCPARLSSMLLADVMGITTSRVIAL
uniref:Polynucleotidyl transferase, Ribonuclease H fold n=1 Tax=Medicago truncatula TaxID=3880 RepID=A2Q568_MEDTR|nr:Polynucleotidyl transferase, Ribonuclease H fold [Medicago truncatula]